MRAPQPGQSSTPFGRAGADHKRARTGRDGRRVAGRASLPEFESMRARLRRNKKKAKKRLLKIDLFYSF
jgi:hypothetical protein